MPGPAGPSHRMTFSRPAGAANPHTPAAARPLQPHRPAPASLKDEVTLRNPINTAFTLQAITAQKTINHYLFAKKNLTLKNALIASATCIAIGSLSLFAVAGAVGFAAASTFISLGFLLTPVMYGFKYICAENLKRQSYDAEAFASAFCDRFWAYHDVNAALATGNGLLEQIPHDNQDLVVNLVKALVLSQKYTFSATLADLKSSLLPEDYTGAKSIFAAIEKGGFQVKQSLAPLLPLLDAIEATETGYDADPALLPQAIERIAFFKAARQGTRAEYQAAFDGAIENNQQTAREMVASSTAFIVGTRYAATYDGVKAAETNIGWIEHFAGLDIAHTPDLQDKLDAAIISINQQEEAIIRALLPQIKVNYNIDAAGLREAELTLAELRHYSRLAEWNRPLKAEIEQKVQVLQQAVITIIDAISVPLQTNPHYPDYSTRKGVGHSFDLQGTASTDEEGYVGQVVVSGVTIKARSGVAANPPAPPQTAPSSATIAMTPPSAPQVQKGDYYGSVDGTFGNQHSYFGLTHIGTTRNGNEDAFLVAHDKCAFAVLDGMGGHENGEYASHNAAETIAASDHRQPLYESIMKAHLRVLEEAKADPGDSKRGTTVSALQFRGDKAIISHLGDSPMYMVRDGELFRINFPHSAAMGLVISQIEDRKSTSPVYQSCYRDVYQQSPPYSEGQMLKVDAAIKEVEATTMIRSNMVSYVLGHKLPFDIRGQDQRTMFPYVPTVEIDVKLGDFFLLTTDGIQLGFDELSAIVAGGGSPREIVEHLMARQLILGAPDNFTALAASYDEEMQLDANIYDRDGNVKISVFTTMISKIFNGVCDYSRFAHVFNLLRDEKLSFRSAEDLEQLRAVLNSVYRQIDESDDRTAPLGRALADSIIMLRHYKRQFDQAVDLQVA